MRMPAVSLGDAPHGMGPRVDDRGCAESFGCDVPGPGRHASVGEGRAVFYHQHSLATDRLGRLQLDDEVGLHQCGLRVYALGVLSNLFEGAGASVLQLVDDDHVRPAEVGFAG